MSYIDAGDVIMGKYVKESKYVGNGKMSKKSDLNLGFVKTKIGGK